MDQPSLPPPRANRSAVISLVAGILTVLSFCIAVAPIPLTGWVCYPAAALLGLLALITGIVSLAQINGADESGRSFAAFGITVGTLAILGSAGAIALGIVLFPKFMAFMGEGVSLLQETGHRIVEFFLSLR